MSNHKSNVAPGVHVHQNGDLKIDPKTAAGVNITGTKVAISAKAVRRLYAGSVDTATE
jgi:hypothetical protein